MKWILGLLCLFFLILFHELGHFIAAKLFGVKVESFSLGYGPVLFHKNIHGTDYRFSLIPLGGYCGMKGEKDFQYALENNLSEIDASEDSLYGIHPLKRAIIGFAGPFFNFIFAIFAYFIINFVGYSYYTFSNKILLQQETPGVEYYSSAKDAGLQDGDIITYIGNKKINDFYDIVQAVSENPGKEENLIYLRDNVEYKTTIKIILDKKSGTGKIGITSDSSTLYKTHTKKMNIFESFVKGVLDSLESVRLTIKSIGILFKGVEVKNMISGPARITDMLGNTIQEGFSAGVKQGFISIFDLLAIISISLFIMNLLPIPILDGGLILISFIEFLIHKKINPKIQYYIQFIGVAFIFFLLIVGLTGDISYFISKR